MLIEETQTFGTNGFQKRNLVLSTDEEYPQKILIEFVQKKCEILDKYGVGQGVKISINLRGRDWTNPEGQVKYFNTIQGWRIEEHATDSAPEAEDAFQTTDDINEEEHDDLPFG